MNLTTKETVIGVAIIAALTASALFAPAQLTALGAAIGGSVLLIMGTRK